MNIDSTQGSVIVVGAGVIGIACAHYLQESGLQVTVIDQSTIGGACSFGNLGYVCPSHVLPLTEPGAVGMAIKSFFEPGAPFRVKPRINLAFWNWMLQFARRCNHRDMLTAAGHLKAILDSSMTEYRRIQSELSLDCEWQDSGLLYVFQTAAGLNAFSKTVALLGDEFGVTARHIVGEELPLLDPALKTRLAGAFHYENDAYIRPDLLNSRWSKALEDKSVTFLEGCKLEDIRKQGSRVTELQTSSGTLVADYFVFATGAWSSKLTSALKCRIPVEPGKGYSVTMARPAICPEFPMLFPEHKVGVTPFTGSYRLGSMMEFVGFDTTIPERRIQQLRKSAEPYLVEPHTEETKSTWYGWRPMTWDSLPIIGRVPRFDNAFLATGHNMLGVSLAAGTGRLLSEIVNDQSTHVDASPYSPERF